MDAALEHDERGVPMPQAHWLQHNDHRFRTPVDLARAALPVGRVLIVGSCFAGGLSHFCERVFAGAGCDHLTYNFVGELPGQPPHPIGDYAFQLVALPLRSVMPEGMFFNLRHADLAAYERALAESELRLMHMLNGSTGYGAAHGLPTFIANFLLPQQNSMGRLLPQNDARNPAWFVARLNAVIAERAATHPNTYVLDFDGIAATIGRRHIQDDIIAMNSHNVFISDWDYPRDRNRLHPPASIMRMHEIKSDEFILAIWTEAAAMLRTIRQQDSVKLVIIDLDDTLWRGVIAEEGVDNPALLEGWPLGIIEALTMLKRRGILLAIVSRNDEATIRRLWPDVIGDKLPLEEFASVRINWDPKPGNVAAVLADCNLLARSALFIDDNPVERAAVQGAHPDIRVLGQDLYYIRRILLWAPELQVAAITEEAGRRTEMIQAQTQREEARAQMPREEFLAGLGVAMTRLTITAADHPRYPRAFELLNKSNQFNTTGRRWSPEEMHAFLAGGGRIEAFEVADNFTQYGLVCVALIDGAAFTQYVMSCRVLGLEVEACAIATLAAELILEHGVARGMMVETDANILCRTLYEKAGFLPVDGHWATTAGKLRPAPGHVRVG